MTSTFSSTYTTLSGLSRDKDSPSEYGKERFGEVVTKPRSDRRIHGETQSKSAHFSRTRDHALSREQRLDQTGHKPSQPRSGAPTDASIKPSPSNTLDFEKMRLSPRKYVNHKGGNSGLSNISKMGGPVVPREPNLLSQSDCASDLTRAVRQRYGKDPRHKGDRKFDYGLE
ncbi:hypothetical protein NPX13_g6006 [Xylaria arbuscula]|uniref:Uncharacterized protein n=1 Tax=Xylaria arbuscula TaxID=114810 RepID=A0A9W8NDD3_9PEZI|nr:hypothetical protein NPX13_g6006 [Xylaria arbuscula]